MNVKEAASVVGCHPRTLRRLIESGKCKARKVPASNPAGFEYSITPREAERVRDNPSAPHSGGRNGKSHGGGWTRGKARKATTVAVTCRKCGNALQVPEGLALRSLVCGLPSKGDPAKACGGSLRLAK